MAHVQMKSGLGLIVGLIVSFSCGSGEVSSPEELSLSPDRKPAARVSMGVREACALDQSKIRLSVGMSYTDACKNPLSYRIVSFDDPAYAYEKFVKPVKASAKRTVELEAPESCRINKFERTDVELELPSPMKEGARYHVVGQGVGGTMVTAAHSAASFVYKAGATPAPAGVKPLDLAVLGLRGVESVGPGYVVLEMGSCLAMDSWKSPKSYKLTIGGKPVRVLNVGRRSVLEAYKPVGWPFGGIQRHEIFLKMERPLADGETLEVELSPELSSAWRKASLAFDSKRSFSGSLKVNQVGYIASSPVKFASLGRWMGSYPELKSDAAAGGGDGEGKVGFDAFLSAAVDSPAPGAETAAAPETCALSFSNPAEFHVCKESGGETVFSGVAKLIHKTGEPDNSKGADHSGENVYQLDFGAFTTPGRYFISVPGVGRSLPFEISEDVYKKAFDVQSYGLFAQRCGIELAPPFSEWRRIACHKNGIVATDVFRCDCKEIAKLKERGLKRPKENALPPELKKLSADPSLVAYYPLDGDFKDASGKGADLNAVSGKGKFTADASISPKPGAKCYGPTDSGEGNGAKAPLKIDSAKGATLSFWFKKNGGAKFDGVVMGLRPEGKEGGKCQISALWGVLASYIGDSNSGEAKYERINDGEWHSLVLSVKPEGDGRLLSTLYCDGAAVTTGRGKGTLGEVFHLGCMTGDEANGAFFDEVRVFNRALTAEEAKVLSTPCPAEEPVIIQAYGGHHDAGDYNPRSHIDVAQTLMDAYEIAPKKFYDGQLDIPEKGNGVPDILDEAYWALRLWAGLQDSDGGVCNGTESAGDPNFMQTVELDDRGDYAFAKDSQGSFVFAGAMAQASRLWKSAGKEAEAKDFLSRAQRAYEWALKNPPSGRGPLEMGNLYYSPKAYAAAQLLHSTGDSRYNKDFMESAVWSKAPEAPMVSYGKYDQSQAAFAYAMCPSELVDAKIQAAAKAAIIKEAEYYIDGSSTMAYAFIRHPDAPISWGTGAYENFLTPVIWAWRLTGDAKYRDWMIRTCDNTLGVNPMGISYIVGLGGKTVHAPLHNSRYSHFGEVVKGQQVQGPNARAEGYRYAEMAYPAPKNTFAILHSFADCHFAIGMDEGTVNAQAKSMAAFGLLLPDKK